MIYDLQKASMTKRISAFMLDVILLVILVTGFMWIISAVTGYETYSNDLESGIGAIREKYGIEKITEEYKIDLDQYAVLTEEERAKYPEHIRETIENCIKEINSDPEIGKTYLMIMNLSILMVSLSLLFSFTVLEFIVPLVFKNGQTVGKKIFAIGVMRIDGIRITPVILFTRTYLGKYTLECMVPAIIILMMLFGVGSPIMIGVIALILLFQIILLIATKSNSCIHDILASTVTVDLPSQMIFDSVEARNEYRLRIHEDDAKNSKYF